MSNEQIYLYRRKGLSDYATCDRARYVELSQHKLFETMIAYTSPPAPVALVLPEQLTPAELEELEVIEVLLHGQGLSNLAGTMASARQFIDEVACLDNKERAQ